MKPTRPIININQPCGYDYCLECNSKYRMVAKNMHLLTTKALGKKGGFGLRIYTLIVLKNGVFLSNESIDAA